MGKTCAIIPAAGRGLRMGGNRPKQFLEISEKPILLHTLDAVSKASFLSELFLVVPADHLDEANGLLAGLGCRPCGEVSQLGSGRMDPESPGEDKAVNGARLAGPGITVIAGGAERQDSVFNGLRYLPPDCEWVLIHDGVRPFVSPRLLEDTWKAARETGAAIAALPATDTVKRVLNGVVQETVSREEMWLVQTPQVFRRELLLDAYERARAGGWLGTDDASFVERIGGRVKVVSGERSNIKVTTSEDLTWASWFLDRDAGRVVD